jgi:HK97 gp10 family phage protein
VRVDNKPIRPEVLAALSQLPEVSKQTRQVANAIRRDARALAPKRTGNLRRHIQVERRYDRATRTVSYGVGWDREAFYGWMVENGTEHSRPRPHLVPAAIANGAVAPRPGEL